MWNKRIIWFSLVIIGCSAVAFAQDARYPVDAQKRGAIIGLLVQLSDALSGNDSDLYEAYLAKFDREATPTLLSIVLDNKIAFDYRRVALRVIERLSPGDDEIRTLGKYFRERAPVYKDLDESDKETWALIRRYFHQYFVTTKSDEVLQPFREFLEDLKCDLVCQNDATLFLMEHPSVNNVPVLQRVLADPQRDEQVRASAAIGIANAGVEDRLTELVLVANWLLERQEGRGHWFLAIRAIDSLKYLAVTNKSERANSALQELAEGVC